MADPLFFWFLISELGEPFIWSGLLLTLLLLYVPISRFGKAPHFRDTYRSFLLVLALSLLLSFIAVQALKNVINVPRPCTPCSEASACNPYCDANSSFPSGHAATAFAAYASIFLFARWRPWRLLIFGLPILVAASRIALGVHTAADVLAGGALGLAICALVYHFAKRRGFVTYIK